MSISRASQSDPPDEELACSCFKRDRVILMTRSRPFVIHVARTKAYCEEDAEDIAVWAEFKIDQALDRGKFTSRGLGSFRAWVRTIVKHETVRFYCEAKKGGQPSGTANGILSVSSEGNAGSMRRLEDKVFDRNTEERIRQLLAPYLTTDAERKVLPFILDGLPPRDIAYYTGVSAAEVARIKYRIGKRLSKVYPTSAQLLAALAAI